MARVVIHCFSLMRTEDPTLLAAIEHRCAQCFLCRGFVCLVSAGAQPRPSSCGWLLPGHGFYTVRVVWIQAQNFHGASGQHPVPHSVQPQDAFGQPRLVGDGLEECPERVSHTIPPAVEMWCTRMFVGRVTFVLRRHIDASDEMKRHEVFKRWWSLFLSSLSACTSGSPV